MCMPALKLPTSSDGYLTGSSICEVNASQSNYEQIDESNHWGYTVPCYELDSCTFCHWQLIIYVPGHTHLYYKYIK